MRSIFVVYASAYASVCLYLSRYIELKHRICLTHIYICPYMNVHISGAEIFICIYMWGSISVYKYPSIHIYHVYIFTLISVYLYLCIGFISVNICNA